MISLIRPILLVGLKNHCVVSQFDHILNMRLRNYYVISMLIHLRNHYVVSQYILHYLYVWETTTWFLKNHASKNRNNFVFRIMCCRWRWDKLNGSFNFSTANFFRIKNPLKTLRKVCSLN